MEPGPKEPTHDAWTATTKNVGPEGENGPGPRDASSPAANTRIPASALIIGALSVVVAAGIVAGAELLWARQHLVSGADHLARARSLVRGPAALENNVLTRAATGELRMARREFGAARADLAVWAPALRHVGSVPRVGRLLRAAPPVADAAYFAASSALDTVRGAHRAGDVLRHRASGPKLLNQLALSLAPGHRRFASAVSTGLKAAKALRSVPAHAGSYTLDQAVARLRRDVPRLTAAARWLGLLPRLLGSDAPASYLFCWENSAEIRPAGGFLGAAELVKVDHGRLRRHFTGSALSREIYFPRLPLQEAALTSEASWLFRDSNVSPDFPTSARLERWFYGHDTGVSPDGVIDFVDQGIPDLLSAVGPVYVKQYHVSVTAANAVDLANRFAGPNASIRGPHKPGQNLDTYRKQFLGFELGAIIKRVENLPVRLWPRLASALGGAINRGDILLYDSRPPIEAALRASSASGSLHSSPGDFLYVVDDNRSYNKIGPYVHEWATYRAEVLPNAWIASTLTIHFHLDPSPAGLEGQGPFFGRMGSKHDLLDFVRVFVPSGVLLQSHSGLSLVGQRLLGAAYGLTDVHGYFLLKPGGSHTIVLRYATPANALAFDRFRRYRLTLPRQPGSMLRSLSVSIQGMGGVVLGRRRMSLIKLHDAMVGSRRLTLALGGPLHPDQVALGPPSRLDPLIPWSAFGRDRRKLEP